MATIKVTQEMFSKLKYINTKGLKEGLYEFPDFLIIGPQRTGTTWLHRNLLLHSDIFLPHTKELYFFNYLEKSGGKYYTSDRLEWYSSQFSLDISKYFQKNLMLLKTYKSIKYLDYNIMRFFSPMVKGEATASYAALKEDLINEIFILNPSIKAIMIIRNPIERAWSHAKLAFPNSFHMTSGSINDQKLEDFFTSDYTKRCGNYTMIIENWKRYTRPGNFFVGFFDDISKNPESLLTSILEFLGLPSGINSLQHSVLNKKINQSTAQKIPERQRIFLQKLFQEEIQKLNRKFNRIG